MTLFLHKVSIECEAPELENIHNNLSKLTNLSFDDQINLEKSKPDLPKWKNSGEYLGSVLQMGLNRRKAHSDVYAHLERRIIV